MILKIYWLLAASIKNFVSPTKLVLCFPKTGSTLYRMREMLLAKPDVEISHQDVNSFSAEIGMRECVYTSLIKSHYAGVGLLFLRCDICILVRQPHDALISLHSYLVRNGATNRSLNDYLRYDGIRRYRTFLFFTRMIMKIKPGVQLVRYDDYLANPWPFHAGASALSEESLNRILDRTSREKTTKNKDNIADKEFSKKKDYSEVNIEKNLLDEIGELTRKFQSL